MKVIGKLFGGPNSESGYLVRMSDWEWTALSTAFTGAENANELSLVADTLHAFGKFADAVKYAHRILNETPAPKAE